MDTPSPQPIPPAQPVTPLPPPQGMGCFAKGCLTLVIACFILMVALIAGGWFALNRAVHIFTSTEPADVAVQQATSAETQAAEEKANALRTAVRNNQETTVEFTATDLNALIANDPDFRGMRGRARVAIANSKISLDVSAPLGSMKWSRLRNRWFNGHVELTFSYVDDNFNVDINSAEANGHSVPSALLNSEFTSSFNRSLNESFRRESRRHPERDELWRHIKMISVQNDKVIVTTRSG